MKPWLDEVLWDDRGLVPAIAQEIGTGRVLMFAHMNREALVHSDANAWCIPTREMTTDP